jgi:hypothetical protein
MQLLIPTVEEEIERFRNSTGQKANATSCHKAKKTSKTNSLVLATHVKVYDIRPLNDFTDA